MRPSHPPRAPLRVVLPLGALVLLSACQGRRLFSGEPPLATNVPNAHAAGPAPAPASRPWVGGRTGRGGDVNLTARDLAPVDVFVDARNAQWILGDDVLVEASREYFGQVLSVTSRLGAVTRTDEVRPDETVITLTFTMGHAQQAIENTPRVMIGTGITVTARRTLRVRLFKTKDSSVPVALRVSATGQAARGRRDQVTARGPQLALGGTLVRGASGWVWSPLG